jgi:hypothetical protein
VHDIIYIYILTCEVFVMTSDTRMLQSPLEQVEGLEFVNEGKPGLTTRSRVTMDAWWKMYLRAQAQGKEKLRGTILD